MSVRLSRDVCTPFSRCAKEAQDAAAFHASILPDPRINGMS
jgi:hypothetical protein